MNYYCPMRHPTNAHRPRECQCSHRDHGHLHLGGTYSHGDTYLYGRPMNPIGANVYPYGEPACPPGGDMYQYREPTYPTGQNVYSYGEPVCPRRQTARPYGEHMCRCGGNVYLRGEFTYPRGEIMDPYLVPAYPRGEIVHPYGGPMCVCGEPANRSVDVAEPHEAYLQMANAAHLQAMNYYGHNPYQLPTLTMPMYPFMAGPPYTAGSSSSSNAISSSFAFRGVQIPPVVNTPTLMHSSGMSPMMLPRMDGYFATGTPMSAPNTYLASAEAIPAMCQQLYAPQYLMHPMNNAQLNLSTSRAVPQPPPASNYNSLGTSRITGTSQITSSNQNASNDRITGINQQSDQNRTGSSYASADQPTSSTATAAEMPALPPTLAAPPLRSAAMRNKRPATLASGPATSNSESRPSSPASAAKRRRTSSIHSEGSASSVGQSSSVIVLSPNQTPESDVDERRAWYNTGPMRGNRCNTGAGRRAARGRQRGRQNSFTHTRPQDTGSFEFSARRRGVDINPAHNSLLSSRMAQMESQRQANSAWYRRHHMSAGSLVAADVVGRRASGHPLVPLSRYSNPLFEISMALLHSEVNGTTAGNAHTSSDPPPVGASLGQIAELTTVVSYSRDTAVSESENEHCTVCLMNFERGDSVRILHCAHFFHVECIDRWLVYNKKCPMCRLDIDAFEANED